LKLKVERLSSRFILSLNIFYNFCLNIMKGVYKMSYVKMILLILLFFVTGCGNDQPVETYQDLFGTYESLTFIEPGSADGGIDILKAGGYLRIILNHNYEYSAELFIRENIQSNYAPGKHNYAGTYSVKDDIISFSSLYIVNQMKWERETKLLKSLEVPPRGRPFEIVLFKYLK
jgi:hypothetical protein